MAQPIHTILKGERFIPDRNMTESRVEEVKRTWPERLFSRPWRPLKSHKFITISVPSRKVIRLRGDYFAHPDLIAEIAAQCVKEEA